jgi:hypothetical protein
MASDPQVHSSVWRKIEFIKEDGTVETYELDKKGKHQRQFGRAKRRNFPKYMNSSTPKDKLKEILQNVQTRTLPMIAVPAPLIRKVEIDFLQFHPQPHNKESIIDDLFSEFEPFENTSIPILSHPEVGLLIHNDSFHESDFSLYEF